MILESSIEKSLLRWCQQRGFPCMKLQGPVGWPDRTVLLGKGRMVFIELKQPGGRVSPHQRYWLERLMQMGYVAGVAYSLDQAVELIQQGLQR